MRRKRGNISLVSSDLRPILAGVGYFVLALLLLLAILGDGYEPPRPGINRPIQGFIDIPNQFGRPAAFAAGAGDILFGDTAALLIGLLLIWGMCAVTAQRTGPLTTRLAGAAIFLCMAAAAVHLAIDPGKTGALPAGMIGDFMARNVFQPYFGPMGSLLLAGLLAVLGLVMATGLMIFKITVIPVLAARSLYRLIIRAKRPMPERARRLADEILSGTRKEDPAHAAYPTSGSDHTGPDRTEPEQTGPVIHITEPAPLDETDPLEPVEAQHVGPETCDFPSDADPCAALPLTAASVHPIPHAADAMTPEPMLPLPPVPEPVSADHCRVTPFPLPPIPEPDSSGTAAQPTRPAEVPVENRMPAAPPSRNEEVIRLADRREIRQEKQEVVIPRRAAVGSEDRPVPENTPPQPREPRSGKNRQREPEPEPTTPSPFLNYRFPPLDLFEKPSRIIQPNLRERLGEMATRLEETLRTYNVEARVTDVCRGPTVTRFELEPAPGVKVSQFVSLIDDIALNLKAVGVRVEAPIPGKARVGIEISNEERDPVMLRELLEHPSFRNRGPAQLLLPLGKGISGEVRVADLTKMPHLLVAGATGSGKTVFVKALIAGLLMQHHPHELQLMLIDPKMVELSIFNDIPHLITPVVTDPKKAASALGWLISEMEERYQLLAEKRARNIEVYNQAVENGEITLTDEDGETSRSIQAVRRLPYIVCVIDELADLMMLARAEVEDAIARLAQLARAVGIHLILATQRPSVDVLTGVIKANFPARISFQVSSRVDSRCILDEIGAERLVGMGDMLYLPAGRSKPERIQGAFVADSEMEALVAHLREQGPPQYRPEIERFGKEKDTLESLQEEEDPLFEDAVRVVLETGQASISMLQRRLRIGYTRAARLIDMMELRGIVGPHTGSKAREILVSIPPGDEEP